MTTLWTLIEYEPASLIPVCVLGIFLSSADADAAAQLRIDELHALGRKVSCEFPDDVPSCRDLGADVELIVDSAPAAFPVAVPA